MPFFDHLEELRSRIIRALVVFVVGSMFGFWLVTHYDALSLLIHPIQPYLGDTKLKYLSPTEPFFLSMKLAFVVGFLLAFPVIVHQIWAFVAPGLLPRERRSIIPAFYLGLVLFVLGMALAYFAALPVTLEFMMGLQSESLEQSITIGEYLDLVVQMLLTFGAVFELPVVILILSALGIVRTEQLAEKRRHAIVLSTIAACFLTPGDALTVTILIMIPLILLYELGIFMARMVERRRAARLAEGEPAAEPT
jgi:sec-independent protein translocase protein TatC